MFYIMWHLALFVTLSWTLKLCWSYSRKPCFRRKFIFKIYFRRNAISNFFFKFISYSGRNSIFWVVNIYAKPWLPSAKRPLEFHENSEKFQIKINGDQFDPKKLKLNSYNLYLCLYYKPLFRFLGDMILVTASH